jgi:uncharacterized protein YdeI (YjbR/CyaY-like superfamily)
MMNPNVDFYFNKPSKWQKEIVLLRKIVRDCNLNEALKWGVPCYTLQKANIVLIHIFKDYCALLFFKGALLSDTHNILIQQTENVQAARQIRFTNCKEINELLVTIKAYIHQAITVEKAGLKVELIKKNELALATELLEQLEAKPNVKAAFEALTPDKELTTYI